MGQKEKFPAHGKRVGIIAAGTGILWRIPECRMRFHGCGDWPYQWSSAPFPGKIMPFFHEMFQHGLGIGLLEQGAVGASGNTLVQDVYVCMEPDDEAQFFSSSRFSGLIMMPPPVEIMRLCAAAV